MRFGRNAKNAVQQQTKWAEPIVMNDDFDLTDTDGLLLLAEQLGLSNALSAPADSSLPPLPQKLDFLMPRPPYMPTRLA
jgi:hypothetical protein